MLWFLAVLGAAYSRPFHVVHFLTKHHCLTGILIGCIYCLLPPLKTATVSLRKSFYLWLLKRKTITIACSWNRPNIKAKNRGNRRNQYPEHRFTWLLTPNQYPEHTYTWLLTPNQYPEHAYTWLITPNQYPEHTYTWLLTPNQYPEHTYTWLFTPNQ